MLFLTESEVRELLPGTVYHFRVRARDAAGNLAVSGDATLTTLVGLLTAWPHEPGGFTPYTDWTVGALAGSGRGDHDAYEPAAETRGGR